MITSLSTYLDVVIELLRPAYSLRGGISHTGVCQLRSAILTARALAKESEEELLIADMRIAELLHQVNAAPRRKPVDIDQEGNVVRLPFQPRIVRVVNPGGGDAA